MAEDIVYGRDMGPVEFMILAFEGNEFNGHIIPELTALVDRGVIGVIDLAVVSKDADGNVTLFEASALQEGIADALNKLTGGEFTGLLSEEDLLMAADELPANSTAAALLVEHLWAVDFAQAVRNSNGWLALSARIPADVIEAAQRSLIAAVENQ
jgi:hypothetical protein